MNYDSDNPFGEMELRRAQIEAQKENTARRAKCYATWTTKGIGEILAPKPFYFNVTFTEEPIFLSGMALAEGSDLIAGHFPRATCGVYEWVKQPAPKGTKEHYVGAYVFFVVDTIGPGQVLGSEPQYTIHHNMLWEGLAMKDLPAHLLDF